MEELSPNIISSIITGAIALVALIISTLVTINKNKYEEKAYFQNNLKEKLENIYLPLKIKFHATKNNEKLINEETIKIINTYGYLLYPELYMKLLNYLL